MVVLVVDSSAMIVKRWIGMLSEMSNIHAVYGAVFYQEALKLFKEVTPGVVLLDSGMPENETIDMLKEIQQAGLKTPVIVLANRFDEYIERQCKSYGAGFFLDKFHEFEKVPEIIESISRGNNIGVL